MSRRHTRSTVVALLTVSLLVWGRRPQGRGRERGGEAAGDGVLDDVELVPGRGVGQGDEVIVIADLEHLAREAS